MSYACVLGWRSQQKVSSEETHKGAARLACLIILSAFPGNPTGALKILLNIIPTENFLMAGLCEDHTETLLVGSGTSTQLVSKKHIDVCNEVRRFLPLLQMPVDRIKKTKVFERNFECQIMDKDNAIISESALNQNTEVYRVGAGFYAEYPNNSAKQAFFHLGIHSTVFQAEV